ncbi:MAG: CarD family transcriptional regulator, partial [Planctomycetota bacterium]
DGRAEAGGLWGSAYAVFLAALAADTGQAVLAVTSHLEEADDLTDDAMTFLPDATVPFPAWEALPSEGVLPNAQVLSERVRALRALSDQQAGPATRRGPLLVVAHAAAVLQDVPHPDAVRASTVEFAVGEERAMSDVVGLFLEREYDRVPLVETPGEFSVRGGIVDVWPHASDPVRLEFFGDTIDSLRSFDPVTQASKGTFKSVKLPLVRRSEFSRLGAGPSFTTLLDHLPEGALVALIEPTLVAERAARYLESSELDAGRWAWLCEGFERRTRLDLSSLPSPGGADVHTRSLQRFTGDLSSLLGELATLRSQVERVVVFCQNPGEKDRLHEMFAETSLAGDKGIEARVGRLSHGFSVPDLSIAFLPHHELFHRHRMRRVAQRLKESRPIESYLELDRGDFVVHLSHGIGKFLGIERLVREGQEGEFLVVEYADLAKLYVPVSKVDLVQKYVGGGDRSPELSKLGTAGWEKRKERVQQAVEALAGEFLEVAALRERELGIAYPKDTPWQKEFEAAFPYEETEDQHTSLEVIKRDMESPRPMDRLICGDVGYGKTELAVRAAFKVAVHGKQVAVLVPTTILAQQHYQTFTERMADYPITVEVISRFRTKGEARGVVERLAAGQVDILIGTHRLLGGDVKFSDLG